jgi:peptidoglycan/xylan/chitin deacetylase (PgdA/CDA1 family)
MIGKLIRVADPLLNQRLTTLIYHRVRAEPDPLFSGEMDARRFAQQMRMLREYFNPLPVHEACCRLREGRLPPRAVCITFDDGYADNLHVASPILREHGLTAAFFIATDFIDGGRMWNDTVIEAIRRTASTELKTPDGDILALGSLERKRAAIDLLIGRCKHRAPGDRAEYVDRVASAAGARLPADLMLSTAELRQMADSGQEIGGHTAGHPILAVLDAESAAREIETGAARLATIVGRRPRLFAYPNGRPGADYSAANVAAVRASSFEFAFTTAFGYAAPASDPLQLPRFTPWAREPRMFAARLLQHFFTAQRERAD